MFKRMQGIIGIWMVFGLISACSWTSVSAQPSAGHWTAQADVLFRAQPIGLAWLPRVGYRVPLSDSKALLYDGTHVEVGGVSALSPASLHAGGYFKVVPLAPLVLKLEAQQLRFLGLFGNLRTFDRPADWSVLDESLDVTSGEHATGYKVRAESIFRVVLGPILGIVSYSGNWQGMDMPADQNWYDPTLDMIFEPNDFMHELHANLAGILWGHPKASEVLALGIRWHSMVTEKSGYKRQMLGGLALWKPGILVEQDFTILATVCGYLEDPYRTGPYVGGALRMTWEKLGVAD